MAEVNGLPPSENVELWAGRVTLDWPTPSLVSQLTKNRLQELPHCFRKGKLDNMVKVRLLLACLFLPQPQLQQLGPELQEISAAACDDEDEWVRVVGAAVGDYSGQLDLQALLVGQHQSNLVAGTLSTLWEGLSNAQPIPGFRPLQEAWMHPDVLPPEAAGARRSRSPSPSQPASNPHFTVRSTEDGARLALAPPPLSQLLEGAASLTGATLDGKGDHARRRGPLTSIATASMFLPAHASHTSAVPAARHATATGSLPGAAAPISTPAASIVTPAAAAAAAPAMAGQQLPEQQQTPVVCPAGSMPLPYKAATSRQPSLPAIGVRPSKLKSLELQESLQLTAAASKSLKQHGHGTARGAQQHQQQAQPSAAHASQQPPSEAVQHPGDMEVDHQQAAHEGMHIEEGMEQQQEEGECGPDDALHPPIHTGQDLEEGQAMHEHDAVGQSVGVKRAHSSLAADNHGKDDTTPHSMGTEDVHGV